MINTNRRRPANERSSLLLFFFLIGLFSPSRTDFHFFSPIDAPFCCFLFLLSGALAHFPFSFAFFFLRRAALRRRLGVLFPIRRDAKAPSLLYLKGDLHSSSLDLALCSALDGQGLFHGGRLFFFLFSGQRDYGFELVLIGFPE